MLVPELNAQKRYYGLQSNASSMTSLLSPHITPTPGPSLPRAEAAFAKKPLLRPMASNSPLNSLPYHGAAAGAKPSPIPSSISDKFHFSPDPASWGISMQRDEPNDWLHGTDPKRPNKTGTRDITFTGRGLLNLGCLFVLTVGLIALFAGWPIITYFTTHDLSTFGVFNVGGTNASGQIPLIPGNWGLIDEDTPKDAHTHPSYYNQGEDWKLVFGDEFNVDGRTFYPGDDPYWEAADLHHWGTKNMEWYDPEAVTTKDGSLRVTLSRKETHGMHFQGGMMSTWNKLCFTGGMILTSVTLPGANNVHGLWPAIWTMGNLGYAGYGASLDGTWPYSYDDCDVGTVRNQSIGGLPHAAVTSGSDDVSGVLSYLPGQRLSRCTCPGESHPGPVHADGSYVGRAAPKIDVLEAQIGEGKGHVSMSAQWAPFNARYEWFNESNQIIYDDTITTMNSYKGGTFQQATSCVVQTAGKAQDCYELSTGCYSTYGFEYKPGFDDAYVTWIQNGTAAWTLLGGGMAADQAVEINRRPIPQEPLYIIVNLGISEGFGTVDLEHLTFPATMSVDWIRVYQPPDAINIGCDPKGFPTKAYITEYMEAYTNPNLTTWVDDYKQTMPKNRWLREC